MAAAAAAAAGRAGAAAAGRAAAVIVVGGGVVLAKWGREGVSPGESRRVSLPLSAKLLETREPASCCRMGRPPAGPPPNSLPAGPAEALPPTALPGGAELDSSLRLPLRARPGRQGSRPGAGRGPESSLPSRQRASRPGQSWGERLSSFYSSPKP